MNKSNMQSYVDDLNSFKPQTIVGFVGPLYTLAKYINANKIPVVQPRSVLTGAEALHEFQREEMEKAFGAKVFNTYGCREFMLMAAECQQQNGLHINIDQLVVETLDEQRNPITEVKGDVAITDLFNFGMPLIRYINGDQATLTQRTCDCGNPLPLIEKINGRKLDIIKTSNGTELPGEFFPHLFKDYIGIERFQVRQKELASIDIYIVKNEHYSGTEPESITNELNRYLKQALAINFHIVADIQLTDAGKHRVTISEL
jgi:phenylacetate-CoA ligase